MLVLRGFLSNVEGSLTCYIQHLEVTVFVTWPHMNKTELKWKQKRCTRCPQSHPPSSFNDDDHPKAPPEALLWDLKPEGEVSVLAILVL